MNWYILNKHGQAIAAEKDLDVAFLVACGRKAHSIQDKRNPKNTIILADIITIGAYSAEQVKKFRGY